MNGGPQWLDAVDNPIEMNDLGFPPILGHLDMFVGFGD